MRSKSANSWQGSRTTKLDPRPGLDEMEVGKAHLPNCGNGWHCSAVNVYRSCGLMWPNMAAHRTITGTERPPSFQRRENIRDAKNGWRTINLLGALPRRGEREREAIPLVNRGMARHKKSSQSPLRKRTVLLFDLEKAPNWRDRTASSR